MRGVLLKSLAVCSLACLFALTTVYAQEPSYDPVAEWNGTHYHVRNGTGQYAQGKVDNPVIDSPFENPTSVAAWDDGANYITFVVDSYNDRIQFFESDISLLTENLDYAAVPVAGEFGGVDIYFTNGGAVQGSEVITIDGTVYTRVDDVAGYAAGDKVYQITYPGAAGTGSHAELPALSNLLATNVVNVEYAFSSDANNDGIGDIDYSIAAAATNGTIIGQVFGITETVPNNAGHPSTFENLVSIAVNLNTEADDIVDLYVLDAGDGAEILFTYKVEDDAAAFEYVSTYEGPLSNPLDVDIEESAGDNTIAVTGAVPDFSVGASTVTLAVRNNTLVNTDTYTFTVVTQSGPADWSGCYIRVDNDITGNTIAYAGPGPAAAGWDIDNVIPGIRATLTWVAQETVGSNTSTIAHATDPVIAEYLFVSDTGNDRIKVIKGGDNGEALTNGADPDFFAGTQRTDHYWISDGTTPSNNFVAATRAEENSFTLYAGSASRTEWTRVNNFSGSGPDDTHYMYDYETQVITLGDGNFGIVPDAGDTILAVYNESIDIINYGTTGSGEGNLNNASGVAARYNPAQGWYDVYVSDTGNNRIVKLKFYPGSTTNPPSVTWVNSWTQASSGSDQLDDPTDVAVGMDGDDNVFVFVCDTGNDRVIVYHDYEAEPDGEGADTAPEYSSVIGTYGTDLGYFTSPVGVSVVNNVDDLDVYIIDSERGYVAKFEEGLSPSIDVDYSNLDAGGYPPNSSFVFQKSASNAAFTINAPPGSYVQFFYSDSLDAASPILCSNEQVDPEETEFSWVFTSTPSGAPDNGTYYLYSRLFNSAGVVMASDNSTVNEALIIDSDLVQGLSIFDPLDDDRYLYIQNGAERVIHFTIDYPDSIVAVNFTGTFPQSIFQFNDIQEGTAWDNLQNNATVFAADWDNSAGTFSINASVLGSNFGLKQGGNHVIAVASITVSSSAVTTSDRSDYSLIDIASGAMTDFNGIDMTSPALNDMEVRTAYLGDVARPDSAYGSVPNIIPRPDGIIGFDDLVVFTLGWNGLGGVQDYIADLGPTAGSIPNLSANPDTLWNVHDLLAFTKMFSWYLTQNFTSGTGPDGIAVSSPSGTIHGEAFRTDDNLELRLKTPGITNLMAAKLTVQYNPEEYTLLSCSEGNLLNRDAETIFITEEVNGQVEIYQSRFSAGLPGVSGSGILASVNLIPAGDDQGEFTIGYELIGLNGRSIESGAFQYTGNGIPDNYLLEQNYPNPFNPVTSIGFQLPRASKVKLEVYNLLGEKVAVLVDGYRNPGYHTVEWNSLNQSQKGISSGIYFYALTAGDFHSVKKMMLLK